MAAVTPHWREMADALWLAAVTRRSAAPPSTVEPVRETAPSLDTETDRPVGSPSVTGSAARPPPQPAWREAVERIEALVDLAPPNGTVPALPGTYRLG